MFNVEQTLSDLAFDRSNLDEVWSNQAILFFQYADKLTQSERRVAKAKQVMEEVEARLYNTIRADLSLSGIRPTEALIESKMKNHEKMRVAREAYDAAKSDCEKAKHALEAFRHRRDMIVQASKRELLELEKTGSSTFTALKKHPQE